MDIYGIEKRKVKQELESLSGRICLTSDLWSSSTMDGFMPPPHTGQLLAEKFIGLLKEWGIEIKVFSLTVDNASANNSFVEILKSHLNMNGVLLCDGDYFHVRCGAHILNLIVQSGLKVVDNCVSKVREMVRYVRGAKARMIKLAEFVSQLSINCKKKLSQDVSTRWNSTYVMLESALQYKVALSQYGLVDKNVVLFSGSQYPTSNLYFHGVYKIQSLISMELQDESSILYETALILSFAVILDPRYKLKFVEYVFRKIYPTNYSEKVRHIYKKMEELYLDYCRISSISSTSVTSCPRVINEDHDEAMDDIDVSIAFDLSVHFIHLYMYFYFVLTLF
ncbi:hypothetical protein DCAR_0313593 [Daucus carota subsp. sativus]|uniref:hAT-like transposase RNase-H fold domain-containing protein n=1 Tax=Daucus carota subsp. sativus TaxID=79200 RepID=A0AAF0WUE7_DAUCS|nr:hypothetical protein DCAR_0313593 [Daucus carota subsp. sativus]